MSVKSYALWNNKGGVGKSTITFHLATRFAELNPHLRVVVVDLCPQANSSMMLLGGGDDGEKIVFSICQSKATPKTVAGYLASVLSAGEGAAPPDPGDFTMACHDFNKNVPDNIHILCGDGNLEPMAPLISQRALQSALTEESNPWKWVHLIVKRFVESLGEYSDEDVVVFIDTNPSFSIYTEIAISAANELLVPINADDASRVATNAMFSLIYGAKPPHPIYGKFTYASRADEQGISRPKVKLIVGNRLTQYSGAASAFGAMSDSTADSLYTQFKSHPDRFSAVENPGEIKDIKDFRSQFSVLLRDFNTAGVVAAHLGIPLSKLAGGKYTIYNRDVTVKADRLQECLGAIDDVVSRVA